MNPLRAKQAYGFKVSGDHSNTVLTALKPQMILRNASAMSAEATMQGLALPILEGASPAGILPTDFPRYFAFVEQCQAAARRLSGGSLTLAINDLLLNAMRRGMSQTVLLALINGIVPVTPGPAPLIVTGPNPANHHPGQARSGTISWTSHDAGLGQVLHYFSLVKHTDLRVIVAGYVTTDSVAYHELEALTVYDWSVSSLNGWHPALLASFDFTTGS